MPPTDAFSPVGVSLLAASVMAALATCHRQAGDVERAIALFSQLFDINKRQSGDSAANQSGIMLARTLTGGGEQRQHGQRGVCVV
jgi:hypothetical protein